MMLYMSTIVFPREIFEALIILPVDEVFDLVEHDQGAVEDVEVVGVLNELILLLEIGRQLLEDTPFLRDVGQSLPAAF